MTYDPKTKSIKYSKENSDKEHELICEPVAGEEMYFCITLNTHDEAVSIVQWFCKKFKTYLSFLHLTPINKLFESFYFFIFFCLLFYKISKFDKKEKHTQIISAINSK